ncbi:MAG: hypothetical protein OEM81_13985 [Acidimicrobiia bacterium]|nr:hypothetical protein [Acidimicrobiia bacterium]MDH3398922.1 hypothetical protein [Acidimicrobiia bacterium]
MTFVYDSDKLTLLEKVGEVAVPPSSHRYIKIPGSTHKFTGFDRNPYLAASLLVLLMLVTRDPVPTPPGETTRPEAIVG